MLKFVEHGLDRRVVMGERVTDARRQPCVIDEFTQALSRKGQVT